MSESMPIPPSEDEVNLDNLFGAEMVGSYEDADGVNIDSAHEVLALAVAATEAGEPINMEEVEDKIKSLQAAQNSQTILRADVYKAIPKALAALIAVANKNRQ